VNPGHPKHGLKAEKPSRSPYAPNMSRITAYSGICCYGAPFGASGLHDGFPTEYAVMRAVSGVFGLRGDFSARKQKPETHGLCKSSDNFQM
jgi:hypothetical protein